MVTVTQCMEITGRPNLLFYRFPTSPTGNKIRSLLPNNIFTSTEQKPTVCTEILFCVPNVQFSAVLLYCISWHDQLLGMRNSIFKALTVLAVSIEGHHHTQLKA